MNQRGFKKQKDIKTGQDRITLESFPVFLKNLRKIKGLSQAALAMELGEEISVRTIEGWEQGRRPAPGMIAMINLILASD